jgi:hypothetical protein
MSTKTWTGAINSRWARWGNWSPGGKPGAGSDVVIPKRGARVAPVASASIGTVNSITDRSQLYFESAGTNNTVTTFLKNAGFLYVDDTAGKGGTILNIKGTLTNKNYLAIGNATLSASDEVKAASLDNTGSIFLTGSSANQALLDVTGIAGFGAAGVLSGYVQLAGDSAVEFAGGQITSLSGSLLLNGSNAFVEDGSASSNNALTGLADIAGSLDLENKATVSTSGPLSNDGALQLDLFGGDGGSSLTVGGTPGATLNNANLLSLGNSSLSSSDLVKASSLVNSNSGTIDLTGSATGQALLDITTGVAGFGVAGNLTGTVDLAGDSAIEFATGQIVRIATGGSLQLDGKSAFIEDSATGLGSNSALTGLSNVAGALFLDHQASVTTSGHLLDAGSIYLDYLSGSGGSTLSTGGWLAITASGLLAVGNGSLSSSSTVTATALNNSGMIDLQGAGNGKNLATLAVSGQTTNNGSISITNDTETLAGAVVTTSAGSFSLSNANLQFNSRVALGQTINETGVDHLTLLHAENFHGTISGFGNSGNVGGNADTIDAANFLLSGTTFNFAGGILTLHDATSNLTANIHMTGVYSKLSFTLGSDGGTGTLVTFHA